MSSLFYSPVDPAHIKKEKAKARELRTSQWWKLQLSKGLCYYCGQKFESLDDLTMDHVLPIGRGGRSTKGNVVPCCKNCNSKKGNRTPVDVLFDRVSNT